MPLTELGLFTVDDYGDVIARVADFYPLPDETDSLKAEARALQYLNVLRQETT